MLSSEDYYNLKMRDLPLFNVEERLSAYQSQLRQELRDHGIHFDFHLWVSDEWFCPDGVPGFALPFYLFNKDLKKIHRDQMGFVDGSSERNILKIARHELGHAIDNAFDLRKNKKRIKLFGSSERRYPKAYQPKPYSQNYVRYLGDHYAQSHPDEDFAETFAYWLDPHKSWHFKNLAPKVKLKLELMDELMSGVRRSRSRLKNKFRIDPIEKNKTLLKTFYRDLKRDQKVVELKRVDHNIRSTFIEPLTQDGGVKLADYLRQERKSQCRQLSQKEGVYQYEAERALNKIIDRAESLAIRAPINEIKAKSSTLIERNFRYLKQKDQLKIYL